MENNGQGTTPIRSLIWNCICLRVTDGWNRYVDYEGVIWKPDTLIYILNIDKLVDIHGADTEKIIPVIIKRPDYEKYELYPMSTRCIFDNLSDGGLILENQSEITGGRHSDNMLMVMDDLWS